jgi:ubiquinone/menaquinone biosynthesis C-methylase UbiE
MPEQPAEAQSFSVKRAEVEFHNFASLGEPERAVANYARENVHRGALIRRHLEFIGALEPFLEIGANVGHTSYLLANEFGASGFALDISADALRHGIALQQLWNYPRGVVRIAGDAAKLPFRDGSLRFVMAFQMLSQFMNIESVFVEVKRVLAPGGVFLFAEEPLLRKLSLRLYRAPYYELMKPWERKLSDWGLLGYLVRDVIGAHQEENFGIRQNHSMNIDAWDGLIRKHFAAQEYEMFVPERGWGERVVKARAGSGWSAARLLGGTLAAICRAPGKQGELPGSMDEFERFLRCPDCGGGLARGADDALGCSGCPYEAPGEGGVYTILPSAERAELYPGDRADIIDFSLPGHEARLGAGWHGLEGREGAEYRWMGAQAFASLARVNAGPQRIRLRGHAHEQAFAQGRPVRISVAVNGRPLGGTTLARTGLFVYESDLPESDAYNVEIQCSPTFSVPPDVRVFSLTFSMIRLAPR